MPQQGKRDSALYKQYNDTSAVYIIPTKITEETAKGHLAEKATQTKQRNITSNMIQESSAFN